MTPPDSADAPAGRLGGTKATILEAALETLKLQGFAGASAREIAKTGGFNQALIFYHFGSVQKLLLAVLTDVSDRRMRSYQPAFESALTLSELATLAREIYREDLENGYVTVLVEIVAGAASNVEFGRDVVAQILPWVDMVEWKVRELTAGSLFETMIPPRDVAFASVALYLGMDMLSHLDGDRSRAESLLELGSRAAPLMQALLPTPKSGEIQ